MGERTPLALLDAAASARMAVGEAITNICAARHRALGDIKLSANWMAACGEPGEDAALYDAVRAVGVELCPALGIAIPVGKDSMSMHTALARGRRGAQGRGAAVADRLGVRAGDRRAPHADAASCAPTAATPRCCWSTSARGRNRLGGSCLAQVYGQRRPRARRTATMPQRAAPASSTRSRRCAREGLLLAYHDRSDGGLFVTLAEMAFAGAAASTSNCRSSGSAATVARAVHRGAGRGAAGARDRRRGACVGVLRGSGLGGLRAGRRPGHRASDRVCDPGRRPRGVRRVANRACAASGPRPATACSAARRPGLRRRGARASHRRDRPGPVRAR